MFKTEGGCVSRGSSSSLLSSSSTMNDAPSAARGVAGGGWNMVMMGMRVVRSPASERYAVSRHEARQL